MASDQGQVLLVGILALAVVWFSRQAHLLLTGYKSLGIDPDEDDDFPSFPG